MSDSCPTVRTVADNEQGYVVRNASDFDPKLHTLFEEKVAAQQDAPDAPAAAAPDAPAAAVAQAAKAKKVA